LSDSDRRKSYLQSKWAMHKARWSLNRSREILRERRQTEEPQHYEEGCLYGLGIRNW